MASLNGLIANLRQAVEELQRALALLRQAIDDARDLRERFDYLGTWVLADRLGAVADGAEGLEARLARAVEQGQWLVEQVEGIRTGDTAGEQAGSASSVASGGASAVETYTARPPATPVPPPSVLRAGRRLPVRETRDAPTTGEFNGERIVSGKDMTSVADLTPYRGGGWPDAMTRHVEAHVAARMRRQGLRQGTVVLNNPTCGTRGYDQDWPLTCDRLLPSILAPGAEMTVWSTTDGGTTWQTKTYTGTGERIRP